MKHSQGNMETNTKLRDAAPELLRSLVSILNWHKVHDPISFIEDKEIKDAEAIIKKLLNNNYKNY